MKKWPQWYMPIAERTAMSQQQQDCEHRYESGVKTFVTVAVGGPYHGLLKRVAVGIEQLIVPVSNGVYAPYRLHAQPDGTKIWLHTDRDSFMDRS